MQRSLAARPFVRTMALASIAGLVACLVAAAASAADPAAGDWPQWRGPDRTGISAETGWRTDWAANPPKTLWKVPVGIGFSTVSISKGRLYTMGNAGGKDTVFCLNADTGEKVWGHSYPCGDVDRPGPRCTPTVDGDKVYTLSQAGDLFCLNAADGKVVWQATVTKQFGVKKPQWGFACSPMVLGKDLVIDIGPIVALDKESGKEVWRGGKDAPAYGSPFAFKLGDKTLIASFNASGPIVVDAAGGKVVGTAKWKTSYDVNSVTPIVVDNTFFISSGYDRGAAVFEIAANGLKNVWENKNMKNHANNCVLWKGFLYGFDGQVDQGPLSCIEYKTGAKKWSTKDVKAGALMIADGKIIAQHAKGDLVVAEASPDGYKELGRIKIFPGDSETCWTQPVLANGRIYCRSHHPGELVCLDVKGK
jgi:outer membrane protein assembly factor BamB